MDQTTPPRPALGVFLLLVAVLLGLVELGVLDYTWERLGIGHRFFTGLLLLSLVGSLVNLPIGSVARDPAGAGSEPTATSAPASGGGRTVLAVNVGGALVPAGLSAWVLLHDGVLAKGLIAVAVVALVTHALARPARGVGIAVPLLVPPIAAAATAMLLSPERAAAVAYAGGSLGTLIGADLANLGKLRSLGAPIVSIGGAGTFDGVFLSGVLAVLLA